MGWPQLIKIDNETAHGNMQKLFSHRCDEDGRPEKTEAQMTETLQKLVKYHAAQVKLWKDLLRNSIEGNNAYAKMQLARHEEFDAFLLEITVASTDVARGLTNAIIGIREVEKALKGS